MKSMTGYGCAETLTSDMQMQVEIKSVNNRYLDIVHNMPYYLSAYEIDVDNKIKEVASRGRVEVAVRVRMLKNDVKVVVDDNVINQYMIAFNKINEISKLNITPQLNDFLNIEGALISVKDHDTKKFEKPLFDLLDKALIQFKESKEREGSSTQLDLKSSKKKMQESLDIINSRADEIETIVKTNLTNRLNDMLEDQNYDENRILQEVAIMLVKLSINEEVQRLAVHFDEFDRLLESDAPIGKRIDFLCQEINREINTIGSKSQIADINLQVVKMKDNLENIREQVRNIE
ncbi:MAG: YicC family protein [Sphaerochaetaceae bacterium]|nr:YicC family protein [Sphaerochaetaceae bacterium]